MTNITYKQVKTKHDEVMMMGWFKDLFKEDSCDGCNLKDVLCKEKDIDNCQYDDS